jgi:hypothetical protein
MPLQTRQKSRIGYVFGGPRRHRGFDQDQAIGFDLFADDLEALLQGRNFGSPLPYVAERLLVVVALDVHHHHIGEGEGLVSKGRCERFLFEDAAADQGGDFGVLRLHRRQTAVEIRDFPVGARRRTLHTDDEFAGPARGAIHRIGDDPGHDRAHEAHSHDHHDFTAQETLLAHQFVEALELVVVIRRLR